MPSLARRTLLRQIAPILLSAPAPSLLCFPAQAAGTLSLQKTLATDQVLSFNLAEAFPGDAPPRRLRVLSIIKPANGKVTAGAKKTSPQITYRPKPGFQGKDTFAIAVAANAVPYTVRVSIVVAGPELPESGDQAILVSDAAQLGLALSSAKPGARIVLAEGTYAGDFVAACSGTEAEPIVIQASKVLGATVAGTFAIKASDVALVGLAVSGGISLQGFASGPAAAG